MGLGWESNLFTLFSGIDFSKDVDIDKQVAQFTFCVELALKLGAPLQIHCREAKVRSEAKVAKSAFQTVLQILKKCDPEKQLKLYWHYFTGKSHSNWD